MRSRFEGWWKGEKEGKSKRLKDQGKRPKENGKSREQVRKLRGLGMDNVLIREVEGAGRGAVSKTERSRRSS